MRDVGEKHWGLKENSSSVVISRFDDEFLQSRLASGAISVVILDGNCCMVQGGPTQLLGRRRLGSFWALLSQLLAPAAILSVQNLIASCNSRPLAVLEGLSLSLLLPTVALLPPRPTG